MTRLSVLARDAIRASGLSIAEYQRHWGSDDGVWHGDTCGCMDDRCVGHHHDASAECGCLWPCIDEVLKARARAEFIGWPEEVRDAFTVAVRALQSSLEARCRAGLEAGAMTLADKQALNGDRIRWTVAASTVRIELDGDLQVLVNRVLALPVESPAVSRG